MDYLTETTETEREIVELDAREQQERDELWLAEFEAETTLGIGAATEELPEMSVTLIPTIKVGLVTLPPWDQSDDLTY